MYSMYGTAFTNMLNSAVKAQKTSSAVTVIKNTLYDAAFI